MLAFRKKESPFKPPSQPEQSASHCSIVVNTLKVAEGITRGWRDYLWVFELSLNSTQHYPWIGDETLTCERCRNGYVHFVCIVHGNSLNNVIFIFKSFLHSHDK